MKLVVMSGPMERWEFPLEGVEMTLGRREDQDICLPWDRRISRQHARLFKRGGQWYIEDVGSANGTFVNNRRIHGPVPIRPGDRIRVGRTWLQAVPEPSPPAIMEAQRTVDIVDRGAEEASRDSLVVPVAAAQPAAVADAVKLRRRLMVLTQVSEAISGTMELEDVLTRIADCTLDALQAERAIIMLKDEKTGEISPHIVRRRGAAGGKVTVSRQIVERALNEHVAVLVQDGQAEGEEGGDGQLITSAICAPLIHRGRELGVIYVDTSSPNAAFTQDDAELLNAIALQAAAAIANARLYTELKQAYENLKQTQQQLVQTEKLSTIGTLAASIAHDMGNIVSPMGPLVAILAKRGSLDEHGREILDRQVQRLNSLIKRLLALAKPAEAVRRPTDPNQIMRRVFELVATEARHKSINIELDLAENLPQVNVDPNQLEQAILNLAVNAVEACGPGNKIILRTELDQDEVVLSVADDGPGMPEEVQQNVFQPFFTTKPTGTGLGLFSARRIAEENGGDIEIDSRPGHGTTAAIRLPAYHPQPGEPEEQSAQATD